MENIGFLSIEDIAVINEHPYMPDLVYDKYKNGRGYYGLVIILDGEMMFEFSDGHTKTLRCGDIALFSPEAAYTVKNHTGKRIMHYAINFNCRNACDLPTESYFTHNDFPRIKEQCKLITDLWRLGDAVSKMRYMSILYAILGELFNESMASHIGKNDYMELMSVAKYIDKNYGRKINLDTLAAQCMMSKTSFRRNFTKVYKVSPIEYLIRIRLMRAAELLLTGNTPVAEIAARCGIDNVSYFCSLFRSRTGYTPNNLRSNNISLEDIARVINKH